MSRLAPLDYMLAALVGAPMLASILACTIEVNLGDVGDEDTESDIPTISLDSEPPSPDTAPSDVPVDDADDVPVAPSRDIRPADSSTHRDLGVSDTAPPEDGTSDTRPGPTDVAEDSTLPPEDTNTSDTESPSDTTRTADADTVSTTDDTSSGSDSRPTCAISSPSCPSGTKCIFGRCVDKCASSSCPHPSRSCRTFDGEDLCLSSCTASPNTTSCGADRKCMYTGQGAGICRQRGPNSRDEICTSLGGADGCDTDLVCLPGSTTSDSRCLPVCNPSDPSTWCATSSGDETCARPRSSASVGWCVRTCDPNQSPTGCQSWERCVPDSNWQGPLNPSARGVCIH